MTRYAIVSNARDRRHVEAYLPANYEVVAEYAVDDPTPSRNLGPDTPPNRWLIAGEDSHGWTLDGYVIPRYASGLVWATEVDEAHAAALRSVSRRSGRRVASTDWRMALDEKLDLARFWQTPMGEAVASGFGESMKRVERELNNPAATKVLDPMADNIAEIEAMKARYAEPVVIADDMMDLVEAAARTFEPEPLQDSDLITRNGFLRLPRPMFMVDRHKRRMSFRAVMWSPWYGLDAAGHDQEYGISLSIYSWIEDMVTGVDDYGPDADNPGGEDPGPDRKRAMVAGLRAMPTKYLLAHTTPWKFGMAVPSADATVGASIREGGWWPQVQAVFRLCQQTIAQRTVEQAPRASVKRARRQLGDDAASTVTVITLRRPRSTGAATEQGHDWQHQWVVNGHWRNQWYPSLGAHRQRWINPYTKGPEDKPLLIKKGRAFRLVR